RSWPGSGPNWWCRPAPERIRKSAYGSGSRSASGPGRTLRKLQASRQTLQKTVDTWIVPGLYDMATLAYRPSGTGGSACAKLDRPPACGTIWRREQPRADASRHERASPRARIPQRPSAAAALADVHRRIGIRVRPGLVLRLVPPDAGQRQDV